MEKLLLLSVLIALVALPVNAARARHPSRALKRALVGLALFNLFYVVGLRFIYPRLL